MKKSFIELLEYIVSECERNGVEIIIRDTHFVINEKCRCYGYYSPDTKKIVIAGKSKCSQTTLLHEFCHFTQFQENTKLSKKFHKSSVVITKWLNGDEYKKRTIKKHLGICRDLELDCDMRASSYLDKYDVGMSKEDYIKMANLSIMFYNLMLCNREWKYSKDDEHHQQLLDLMSNKFDMNYSKVDPAFKKALE